MENQGDHMERIAQQIQGLEFDWYVTISRGGLVPACLLAQITGQRQIDTFCVWSYAGNRPTLPAHVLKESKHLEGQTILLIDDLVDSGKTMESAVYWIHRWHPKSITTAVLYKKDCSIFIPDYWAEEISKDKWLDFPWEKDQRIEVTWQK